MERWTPEPVAEAVIEAFRVLPTMPVYSPRKAEFVPVLPGQDPSPLDVLAISEQVLGRSTPDRRFLLVWARAKATRGDIGGSVRQYCVEMSVNLKTFDRRRIRACERVADAIVPDIARGLGSLGLSHADLGTYVGSSIVRWEKLRGREEGARHFTVRSVDDVEVAPTAPGWKPSA